MLSLALSLSLSLSLSPSMSLSLSLSLSLALQGCVRRPQIPTINVGSEMGRRVGRGGGEPTGNERHKTGQFDDPSTARMVYVCDTERDVR